MRLARWAQWLGIVAFSVVACLAYVVAHMAIVLLWIYFAQGSDSNNSITIPRQESCMETRTPFLY